MTNNLTKPMLVIAASLLASLLATGSTHAQVAGSTTIGVAVAELTEVAKGWSAKKGILGKTLYSEIGERVGKIDDLIVAPDKSVSYLIVAAGGFVGIGRHDVAIPMTQIRETEGRIILPGATRDTVKAMPRFDYASDAIDREQFISKAEQDIANAHAKLGGVENRVVTLTGEAKAKLNQELVALRQDMKFAEDRLGEMKRAGVKGWRKFETAVNRAIARAKHAVDKAAA